MSSATLPAAITPEQAQGIADRLFPLQEKWFPLLGLEDWQITTVVSHTQLGDAGRFVGAMSCEPDWPYLKAHITVSGPNYLDRTDTDLERDYLHELCHIVIEEALPYKQNADQIRHEERVVTMLAKAFLRVAAVGAS